MRTPGAKNIVSFESRDVIDTSSSSEVRHLAMIGGTPCKEFIDLLVHQANFLTWVESRHQSIVDLDQQLRVIKREPPRQGPAGAKEETYLKYRWYAEQLVVLETINAFEGFYKKLFIALGTVLQEYVHTEKLKGSSIDARVLWAITDQVSVPALVFEHKLFHDLAVIDECCEMLVCQKRYKPDSQNNPLHKRVRALRAIFQIRHTLSHNGGLVTNSDAAKFVRLKYRASVGEVIDPSKNNLRISVFRLLESEATEFTDWIGNVTAKFLQEGIVNRGLIVSVAKREQLEKITGPNLCWNTVHWS